MKSYYHTSTAACSRLTLEVSTSKRRLKLRENCFRSDMMDGKIISVVTMQADSINQNVGLLLAGFKSTSIKIDR